MNKLQQWQSFSLLVEHHIRKYVVAQYGDYLDRMVEGMTPEKIQFCLLPVFDTELRASG